MQTQAARKVPVKSRGIGKPLDGIHRKNAKKLAERAIVPLYQSQKIGVRLVLYIQTPGAPDHIPIPLSMRFEMRSDLTKQPLTMDEREMEQARHTPTTLQLTTEKSYDPIMKAHMKICAPMATFLEQYTEQYLLKLRFNLQQYEKNMDCPLPEDLLGISVLRKSMIKTNTCSTKINTRLLRDIMDEQMAKPKPLYYFMVVTQNRSCSLEEFLLGVEDSTEKQTRERTSNAGSPVSKRRKTDKPSVPTIFTEAINVFITAAPKTHSKDALYHPDFVDSAQESSESVATVRPGIESQSLGTDNEKSEALSYSEPPGQQALQDALSISSPTRSPLSSPRSPSMFESPRLEPFDESSTFDELFLPRESDEDSMPWSLAPALDADEPLPSYPISTQAAQSHLSQPQEQQFQQVQEQPHPSPCQGRQTVDASAYQQSLSPNPLSSGRDGGLCPTLAENMLHDGSHNSDSGAYNSSNRRMSTSSAHFIQGARPSSQQEIREHHRGDTTTSVRSAGQRAPMSISTNDQSFRVALTNMGHAAKQAGFQKNILERQLELARLKILSEQSKNDIFRVEGEKRLGLERAKTEAALLGSEQSASKVSELLETLRGIHDEVLNLSREEHPQKGLEELRKSINRIVVSNMSLVRISENSRKEIAESTEKNDRKCEEREGENE